MAGGIEKFGDWKAAGDILARAGEKLKQGIRKAMLQEGHFFRSKMVEGFTSQAPGGESWEPLSEYTIAIRKALGFKGTKALIRNADLRNSITVLEQADGVFIGVLRTATSGDGKSLVNVAAVHEYGAGPIVIRMTDGMRKFLHDKLEKGGMGPAPERPSTGIVVVFIPARPFVKPVFDTYGKPADVSDRVMRRLAHLCDGDFGFLGPPPPTR